MTTRRKIRYCIRCKKRRQFVETIDGLECAVCESELDDVREHLETAEKEREQEEFDAAE